MVNRVETYHSHSILLSKLVRATAKAMKGDIGEVMSRLNFDSVTFPNITISVPFYISSKMKFLIEAFSTLPLKFN